MVRRAWLPLALALMTLFGSLSPGTRTALAATHDPSIQVAQDANLGTILTGPNGMTLYLYTKDSPGVSNCYDQCAVNWPPLLLQQGEQPVAPAGLKGTLATTTRKDGSVQATYNGWPLYYWVRDKKPGDTTGQNVGKVWFVLNPDSPTVKLAQDPKLGALLTGPNGMTLYVYTKDVPGTTNCYGQCAVNWPPLLLGEGELLNAPAGLGGKLGTTARTDGSLQVTLNGAPLYYWVKDKAPGETTGHKVGGVWFVAEPGLLLDTAGTWSQSQVATAVRDGWAKGNPDGTFGPDRPITQAEFNSMLTAAFHMANAPAAEVLPNRNLSREEAMVLLVRALGLQPKAGTANSMLSQFTDAARLSEENAPLVSLAIEAGIVQGYPDKTLRGEQVITRAEAVVMILRALSAQT